ncbi:C6 zinc finger domain protein [Aspergillus novofumigatus IBT 16806]|uniref:C6 zinc finger domain protein n=1 Tax=Aspergillus novofumigatus (strain IBT 16806) TaxID=1392255 RepID=A0A2I1BW71_ASPN1|nr:C6 zinc finger domain protein [Aspergillus novofumigatus IBT 16806]PKX89629.1 C6 zinc finger domain protein [Aspergillus novofumigatus IBT 16806]
MPTLDPSEPEADRRAPPVVRRSALGCTKVRDSCHSCATSKIKCPREKPSCSKCVSRGIECQYFFARRPGRRRDHGSGHPTSCTSNSSSPSSLSSSSSPNPKSISDNYTHGALPRSGDKIEVVGPSPQQGYAAKGTAPSTSFPASNGSLDTPQSFFMMEPALTTDNVLGQYSSDLSSVLADSNTFHSLPDFDTGPNDMDFSMPDYFEHPAINGDGDIGSLLIPETISFGLNAMDSNDPLSAPFAVSSWVPSLTPSVPTSSTTDPNMMTMMMMMMGAPLTTDISCSCVSQALDLLKTLSSAQSSSPASSISSASRPALSSGMTAMGSAQAVLVENKHHIETVSNLLSCSSCTEDAFRLVIVSMIVLKILERYASVVRIQGFGFGSRVGSVETDAGLRSPNSMISSSKDQMRALSRTYTVPRDDCASGYAPARLVLGELHRVQRLVNRLSPKLRGCKEGDARGMEHPIWGRLQVANGNDKTQSTPFYSDTLAQMESDMRTSLSSLSAHIINRLGQN